MTGRRSMRLSARFGENIKEEKEDIVIITATLKRKSSLVLKKDKRVLSSDEDDHLFNNSKRPKQQKKTKPKPQKSKVKNRVKVESSTSESEEENSSFKENEATSVTSEVETENNVKEEVDDDDDNTEGNETAGHEETEVELIRRKNIEVRMKMFQELKLGDLKQEIESSFTEQTVQAASLRRSSLFSSKATTPTEPQRKSARLLGLEAMKLELPPENKITIRSPLPAVRRVVNANTGKVSIANYRSDWGTGERDSTPVLNLQDALHSGFVEKDNASLLLDMCMSMKLNSEEQETTLTPENCSLDEFRKKMDSLTLKEYHKMKVLPDRVYSLAFNPLTSGFMVAAGCKSGAVGLWKVDLDNKSWDESKVVAFDYHAKPANCITFGMEEPHLMYTTSYDGTFRRGDLQKQEFTLLYETPACRKDNHTCWHVEVEPNVFLIGVGDGSISRIDAREDAAKRTDTFRCHDRSLRTISMHPGTGMHFASTSSFNKEVAIWDMRAMSSKTPFKGKLSSIDFPKTLSSAFFSPLTGNALLTTSSDDKISVYDTSNLQKPKLQSKISHNNHTGRWITNFRAVWHPQREDVCLIGSMDRPQRKLELFEIGPKIKPLTELVDDQYFTTIGAVAVFHPYIPAVAAANASGYIHIFM